MHVIPIKMHRRLKSRQKINDGDALKKNRGTVEVNPNDDGSGKNGVNHSEK